MKIKFNPRTLNQALRFCRMVMHQYIPPEWRVEVNFRYKTRYGTCCHLTRRIELNADFIKLVSEFHLEQLILHEIAHALTPHGGHGKLFQDVCEALGCETPTPHFKWKHSELF